MTVSAGSVWWINVVFVDGAEPRKKYIVLLTDCVVDEDQAIVVFTTSRGNRYPLVHGGSPCGCPASPCFRIDAKVECFPEPTWVQFDNRASYTRVELSAHQNKGNAGFIHSLSDQTLRALLKCATKSLDIPPRSIARIDQTLKALNKKNATPPKAPSSQRAPQALPVKVSEAISKIQGRIDRYCANCKAEFTVLVGIDDLKLNSILEGTAMPPEKFEVDVAAGFDLVKPCASCQKHAP